MTLTPTNYIDQSCQVDFAALPGALKKGHDLALSAFKDGSLKVLVATDIAARGIDVDDLALVVNYDLPNIPETYVHRIGRTGRAKASGIALSFCATEERPFLKDIQKKFLFLHLILLIILI